ncbi:DUF4347 domain-containing protein [Pseudomonas sp. NPDC047961]
MAWWTRRENQPQQSTSSASRPHTSLILPLEPRMMFDGAVAATGAEAFSETQSPLPTNATEPTTANEMEQSAEALDGGVANSEQERAEIVFIDTGVAGWEALRDGVREGVEVMLLDATEDGLTQMVGALKGRSGIDAIHVLSHGAERQLRLGTLVLDDVTVAARASDLAALGATLSESGDLLLYGCSVADSASQDFLSSIARATGADVAASTDATGSALVGGDWDLEHITGSVETGIALTDLASFNHLLASTTLTANGVGFSDLGPTLIDGEANTADVPGKNFEIFYTDSATSNTSTDSIGHFHYTDSDLDLTSYPNAYNGKRDVVLNANQASAFGGDGSAEPFLVLRTQDGSEFSFNGIDAFNSYALSGNEAKISLSGYRDGVLLGSVTLTIDSVSTFHGSFNQSNGLAASVFQNVDRVVITTDSSSQYSDPANPNYGLWMFFNGFVVGDAVVPANAPSLSGSGNDPLFTENGSAVDLFSSVTASTNDSGQTFSGMAMTVTNVSNGSNEILSIGGTDVALSGGNSGTIAGIGNYSVSVAGGTATVTLSGMTRSGAQMGTLIDGMTYRNSSEAPSTSSRVVTITSISDSGGSNNAASPNIAATVTVDTVNDAPTATNLTQSKTTTEGGGAVALDDIVLSDVDSGDTVTATLTLSNASAGSLSTGTYGAATSTFNAGTGVWTVTGSVTDVNAALAAVALTPSANNEQNFTITTRIRDAANTGPTDGTISVTVTTVNDAPTATHLTQSKSATEGSGPVALDDIVVSDVDSGDTVTATLALSNSAAGTLSTGTYGSATSTYNAGTGIWIVTGSVADVNAALAAVALTPSSNNDQNFTITTRIRDAAATGPADGTITVTVTGVNDAPTATNLTQTKAATEGGGAVALDDIVVSDVDSGETVTATLTLSNSSAGSLSTGTYGAATSTYNAGTGGWTVTGSVSDVNASLAAVAFTPSANNDQNFTITTRIRDAANTGPADGTITVTVTPVNDAPVLTTTGGSVPFTENAPPVAVDSALTLSDVDSATMTSATVSITGNYNAGQDVLGFVNDGSTMGNITASYNAGTGVLTLTSAGGTASLAQWRAALRGVTYSNSSEAPSTASRTLSFTANDGSTDSNVATRTLSVTPVNDAPTTNTATGFVNTGASTETGGALTLTGAHLHEGDPDDQGTGITYTVTTAPTDGTLFLDGNGNGVVDGGEGLGATSTFTQDDVDNGRVKYLHGGGVGSSDSFTFSVADGGEDGAAALTGQTFSISVAERPVVAVGGGSPAHTEDGTATVIAPNLTITDGDSANTAGATVIITDFVSGDVLGFTNQNGITGSFNAATGVLTLTGTASRADYQTALRSLTYGTTSDNPATGAGNADRVIELRVNDGVLQSAAGTSATVTVANANDAPVLDASQSPSLVGVAEDAPAPTNGSTASSTLVSALLGGATDVDSGALQGITITGTSSQGTLWYSTDGGTTWTQVPVVSAANALLLQSDARLYLQPDANVSGCVTDAITFRAWDRTSGSNGGTADTTTNGEGTAFSTSTDTVAVSVTAVNDAPTIDAGPLALTGTNEDTASSATAVSTILAGLSAADADSGAQTGIAVTSASGNGTWQYTTNGTDWCSLGTVSSGAALLLDGSAQLRYVPDGVDGETAGAAPTIGFRAWDQTSGTATSGATRSTADVSTNGGTTAYSATQASAALTVTAVNDAPTLVSGTVPLTGTNENSTSPSTLVSTILASSTVSDVDTGAVFGIAITGSSGNGAWQYSTNGAAWTAFGDVSDSSALLLNSTTRVRLVGDGIDGGTATFTWRAWDMASGSASANSAPETADASSNGGSTSFSSTTAQASLNVTSVNDAPTLTLPGGQTVESNGTLTLNGTPIVLADVDAGSGALEVTLTATQGTASLGSASGLTFSNGDGVADASMTFTGSLADINTALSGLSFAPANGYVGTAGLRIDASDLGNTGAGGILATTGTIEIQVTAPVAVTVTPPPPPPAPATVDMTPAPPPVAPPLPPASVAQPLLPPPLFEPPTLGAGLPPVGSIFLQNNALAPSYLTQVFASENAGGDGGGAGFLGFRGSDGGVFGTSTLGSIFSDGALPTDNGSIFGDRLGGSDGGGGELRGIFGAPSLGQQLETLNNNEKRQIQTLANALGSIAKAAPQA